MKTYRTKSEAVVAAQEAARNGEILLDEGSASSASSARRAFIGRQNRRYFFAADIHPLPPTTQGIVGMVMPDGSYVNFTGK